MRSRANLVLALVVGSIVVVAVVVAVLASGRSGTELPEGSPEAAVQGYLEAVLDRDAAALEWLEPDTACEPSDLSQTFIPDSARAVLVEVDGDGDAATVTVEIAESTTDSPFGADEYVHDEFFALERIEGEWRITGTPWPLFGCDEERGS